MDVLQGPIYSSAYDHLVNKPPGKFFIKDFADILG